MNDVSIRRLEERDAPAVASLLHALAVEFIVPGMAPEAAQCFLAQHDEAALHARLAQDFVYHVAECGGEIAGFIGVRGRTHVFHLFVGSAWHKRGVARALWKHARSVAQQEEHDGRFTVNSSPFAVPVYAAMGFVATAPMQCVNGVQFHPMRYPAAKP